MEMLLSWLFANWMSVLLVLGTILVCVYLWKQGYKRNVYILLLEIVNEVEEKYGKEDQDIKYDIILGKLYPRLPKVFTWLVSVEELDDMITNTIDEVQEWLDNEINK